MEFVLGGTAAAAAGFFTNPLDVVKVRFQLQGELKARGLYAVHYKNLFHAFFQIVKHDGFLALQKGLLPASCHQVVLNGIRLGLYQVAEERGWTISPDGNVYIINSIGVGIVAGGMGAFLGSPILLVKTHIQSKSSQNIAVGTQHQVDGIMKTLGEIYSQFGLRGLFRGSLGAVIRVMVGSSSQLTSFTLFKSYFKKHKIFSSNEDSIINTFAASMIGGVFIAIFMAPFDTISTRLYNQGVDKQGRGLLYNSYMDCVRKTFKQEGVQGLYKGILPCYLRIGPHTVLSLMFWDMLRGLQTKYSKPEPFLSP
uniref:Solute carrier family 25 member 35 n=2 Tax=Cacopsylla melanoneura TaxID=428564 RepID=A0A8D8Y5T9_9HEMI